MNKETEMHFSNIPDVNISRSKFVRPHQEWTTFNAGDLIPIYIDTDIMPGDTVKMKMASVVRMMTPLVPVMDNCWADITFFFVPHRLVWYDWKQFWGENESAPWINEYEYIVPQTEAPATTGWEEKSLADYLGYPLHAPQKRVSSLPARAYIKIWNDFWRDQNWKNPVYMDQSGSTTYGTNPSDYDDDNPYDYVTETEKCAKPLKAAKMHDYFTSVLPGVQKGPDVHVPLGESAPVKLGFPQNTGSFTYWEPPVGSTNEALLYTSGTSTATFKYGTYTADATNIAGPAVNYKFNNLYADLSTATGATITALRQAFAVQRFYEALARGGSRYTEMIRAVYGVTNPDFRLQRAEYVGGFRMPINVSQVVQSDAGASDATPLGHTGAMSITSDNREDLFTHSFTEHGTLMGLITIRHDMSYSQGCPRMYTRKKLFDFYTPQLANLSEQPVMSQEIYCDGTENDETAWGYQEAWADYRYFPNQIKGEMRETYAQSLGVWTYQDYYTERPTMGDKWIDADDSAIKRTLAVQNHDEFFANFYFKPTYIRPMPVYSIPSLSSHF